MPRHHPARATAPCHQPADTELAQVTDDPLTANPRSLFSRRSLLTSPWTLTLASALPGRRPEALATTALSASSGLCVPGRLPGAPDPSHSAALSNTPTLLPPRWLHLPPGPLPGKTGIHFQLPAHSTSKTRLAPFPHFHPQGHLPGPCRPSCLDRASCLLTLQTPSLTPYGPLEGPLSKLPQPQIHPSGHSSDHSLCFSCTTTSQELALSELLLTLRCPNTNVPSSRKTSPPRALVPHSGLFQVLVLTIWKAGGVHVQLCLL